MLLLHTALPFEAHPFIRSFDLRQVASPADSRFYLNDPRTIALIIAGTGKENTHDRLGALNAIFSKFELNPSTVISIGIAGALGQKAKTVGRLYTIRSCKTPSMKEWTSVAPLGEFLSFADLITVDYVVNDPMQFGEASLLVDMEGFHTVLGSRQILSIDMSNIHLMKVVSDTADGDFPDWREFSKVYDSSVTPLVQWIESKFIP
jgi:hypothetical protein